MANTAHLIKCLKQSTTTISGIGSLGVSPALRVVTIGSDSEIYNTYVSVMEGEPGATFRSPCVAAMITQFGVTGQAIAANALELYTVYASAGGTRAATGEKISVTKGIIVPTTLQVSHGGVASIEYAVVMGGTTSDADPFSITSAQTVPTSTGVTEAFTLGDCTLNAQAITLVRDVTIDFGFTVTRVKGDGYVWPQVVYIARQQPRVTLTTAEATALASVTVDGTSNVLVVEIEKLADGGTRAGSGDKTFTMAGQINVVDDVSGEDAGEAMTRITCTPTYDGANTPITVA